MKRRRKKVKMHVARVSRKRIGRISAGVCDIWGSTPGGHAVMMEIARYASGLDWTGCPDCKSPVVLLGAYSQGRVSHAGVKWDMEAQSMTITRARASSDRRLGISPQEGAMHPPDLRESIQGHREERERECEHVKLT